MRCESLPLLLAQLRVVWPVPLVELRPVLELGRRSYWRQFAGLGSVAAPLAPATPLAGSAFASVGQSGARRSYRRERGCRRARTGVVLGTRRRRRRQRQVRRLARQCRRQRAAPMGTACGGGTVDGVTGAAGSVGACGGILPSQKGSPHKPGDTLAGAPMRKASPAFLRPQEAPECRPQHDLQLHGPGAAIGNSTCSGRPLRCSLDSGGVRRSRAVV